MLGAAAPAGGQRWSRRSVRTTATYMLGEGDYTACVCERGEDASRVALVVYTARVVVCAENRE